MPFEVMSTFQVPLTHVRPYFQCAFGKHKTCPKTERLEPRSSPKVDLTDFYRHYGQRIGDQYTSLTQLQLHAFEIPVPNQLELSFLTQSRKNGSND